MIRLPLLRLLSIVACICLSSPGAFAWGPTAHRIIASLAWRNLEKDSPETIGKINSLLGPQKGGDPLTSVATWADEQKSGKTRNWHFVNIPLTEKYNQQRDCPNQDCVVEVVNRLINQLQSGKTRQQRIDALKYLVHLVGDLHQPLHVTDNNDLGGNKKSVIFFGKVTNLHSVWDEELIKRTGLSEESYINKLEVGLPYADGWVYDWADESHQLAQYAYKLPSDRALGNAYYRTNLTIVDRQLARAGVRLAHILKFALQ